ncbi:hypothetical protein TherJR_2381 [Thermincola potens JR]|uniref:Uncharacterized protein n=1 Tax=Thermincola potens (strain JR) TaxID=635013 RepID=D5XAL7_THEPJ|nr:hypothetical protein TherJR_2381 [Thermincola potens JR]
MRNKKGFGFNGRKYDIDTKTGIRRAVVRTIKSLALITFGTLWLMFALKWRIAKKDKFIIPAQLVETSGKWDNCDCACGTVRDDWHIVSVHKRDFKYLFICPKCGQFWEEAMVSGGITKWRPVQKDYVLLHYDTSKI